MMLDPWVSAFFIVMPAFMLMMFTINKMKNKKCTSCQSWIPKGATKCPKCTVDLAA